MGIQNHLTLEKYIHEFIYVNALSEKKTHNISLDAEKSDAKTIHHTLRAKIKNRRELAWLYKGYIF